MAKYVQYFVEGECEEKIIKVFQKNKANRFIPGKVEILNAAFEKISKMRIMQMKKNTTVILVYDTDKFNIDILKNNVSILKKSANIESVIHVQSIEKFEDEIVYSTDIKSINDVFKTANEKDFKNRFIECKALIEKLSKINFNFNKIWTRCSNNKSLHDFTNEGSKIKC